MPSVPRWFALSACLIACRGDGAGTGPEADAGSEDAALPRPARDAGNHEDAGPDAGPDAAQDAGYDAGLDACANVPEGGRCADAHTLETCSAGSGTLRVPCDAGEVCVEDASGAACAQGCEAGATRCDDATTLATCDGTRFVPAPCVRGCRASELGAFCAPDLATRSLAGVARYEARTPDASYDDWSADAVEVPAARFTLLSYHGDTLVDAVETADDGAFTLQVADASGADDTLVLTAAHGRGGTLAYAVADPGFAPSGSAHGLFEDHPAERVWSWRFAVPESGDAPLRVTQALGAGAAHVYATLRQVTELGDDFYAPATPRTLVAWVGVGTAWSCGACMASTPAQAFGTQFDRQLWFDGSSDEGYWSSAVTAHELGHYLMSAYGFEPREGGPHYLGVKTNPGQAYSEGFATFFSSALRGEARYYDKQGSVFFWWDLDARVYDEVIGAAWERAVAADGLEQLMNENEVAAILYDVYGRLGSLDPVLTAVASPRMTTTPFARGYTERTWNDFEHPELYTDTGRPHPYLADLLDALRCADALTASELDLVTEPALHYPYPSEVPLCD